jgi:phage baseplate assembly protein W
MGNEAEFIGIGWAFPPAFEKVGGSTVMAGGAEDIRQSLHILLSTTLGERVMRADYGCNLRDYVFDPVNRSMEAYIKKLVEDAIIYYEPRITLDKLVVDFQDNEGLMIITIEFTVDATNSRANFVYPFYLNEAKQ